MKTILKFVVNNTQNFKNEELDNYFVTEVSII